MREAQIEMQLRESLGQADREPQAEMALGEPSVGPKWPGSCSHSPAPELPAESVAQGQGYGGS